MRWFVTGDTHGDWSRIWNWLDKMDFTRDESISVIILGDAGLFWRNDKKDANEIIKHHEENYNVHIYFLDGNHENFKILKQYKPSITGIVNISNHIHYLPRGFNGHLALNYRLARIVVCGGADSIDKFRRTEGLSWWKDETITDEDVDKIPEDDFDYVFTHCCPSSVFYENKSCLATLSCISEENISHESEDQLEKLKNKISYKKWFFGHYHVDRELDNKHRAVLNDFVELF